MSESIVLKKTPRIEFQLHDNGFKLIDGLTESNNGFYNFNDLQSIELNKVWFPRLAKWLRFFTCILNSGVPYFPDAETYKKANLIFHFKKTKLGIWLTDTSMADNAIRIKELIDNRTDQHLKS